jgi:hypothetical protein
MKTCRNCGLTKQNSEFRIRPEYMREGKPIEKTLYTHCKECERKIGKSTYLARKNAPPPPANCDLCGKKEEKLKMDHDHETHQFRGWLCNNCNRGLGYLGDNIAGLEKAILYLNECQSYESKNYSRECS